MRKLNKTQEKKHQKLLGVLGEAKDELEAGIEEFNTAVGEAWDKLEEKHGKLQEAIEAAEEFRQEIYDAQEDYASERSDAWPESDSGSAYLAWQQEWESELETPEIDKPEELEMPEVEAIETFENLPPEPG
jgi:SMC interacting uncharacterized protein involved in chromosome segregation